MKLLALAQKLQGFCLKIISSIIQHSNSVLFNFPEKEDYSKI